MTPGISSDAVVVWQLAVGGPVAEPRVSAEERARAGRFARERDRNCYLACRSTLRRLLAECLGRDPLSLVFRCGPHGKPELEDGALAFNISHSGDVALIAISVGRRVGVDVEQVRERVHLAEIARRYFSPGDADALLALAPEQRLAAFYRHWTRYEALVKATGDGIGAAVRDLAELRKELQLVELEAPPGYAAAVAADGPPWRVIRRDVSQTGPGALLYSS